MIGLRKHPFHSIRLTSWIGYPLEATPVIHQDLESCSSPPITLPGTMGKAMAGIFSALDRRGKASFRPSTMGDGHATIERETAAAARRCPIQGTVGGCIADQEDLRNRIG